jgi:hypothetical protein
LHVCDQTGHAAAAPELQKILGAFESHSNIAKRPDEARQSLSYRMIVVDDRYDGGPWQFRSLTEPEIMCRMGFRHCTSVGSGH